jgi:hypothetical protein
VFIYLFIYFDVSDLTVNLKSSASR